MSRIIDLDALNTEERIDLIGEIWNGLSAHPNDIPIDSSLMDELGRRMADYDADPSTASPWEDVKSRILNRK